MNVLDDQLRSLAAHLDQELGAKVAVNADTANRKSSHQPRATRPVASRRLAPRQVAVFGLAAASLIGGLIVITSRSPNRSPVGPSDSPPTTPVAAVPSSNPVATTQTTTAPTTSGEQTDTSATTSPSSTTTSTPLATQLADIRHAAALALASLTSLRATVQRHSSTTTADGTTTDGGTSTNTVTLMADGREWSEGDQILWSSYDPTTGISRGAFTDVTGAVRYQQIDGQSDSFTPVNIMFGYNPLAATNGFGSTSSTVTLEETEWHGRTAWQITTHDDTVPFTSQVTNDTRVYVVDTTTGLIVSYSATTIQNGVTSIDEAEVSALDVGVDVPATFPGEFPAGATVDRSGDPAAFVSLTVAEAVAVFGRGVYGPADMPAAARLSLATALGQTFNDLTLTVPLPGGFGASGIAIRMDVPTSAAPPDPGFAAVDGFVCPSADGLTCNPPKPGLPTLSAGALAGHPYETFETGILIYDGAITISIGKPTVAEALAVANSLVHPTG
jgi:hypothetical protein